jgi:hypothetical protein
VPPRRAHTGPGKQYLKAFLLSNADYEHVDLLMTYAYGSDWLSLFDLVVVNARKRTFFDEPDASSADARSQHLFSPVCSLCAR